MQEDRFFKRLQKSVIMADGAIGTLIQQLASAPVECVESINLLQPELILEIHKQYIEAGSEIIKTNTFGANRLLLEKYNLADKVQEINRAGVRLARQAGRSESFIAGSVGPFLPAMEELAARQTANLEEIIREQLAALLAEGIDLLLLETYGNLGHLVYSLKLAKEMCGLPVIASLTTDRAGMTFDGVGINAAAEQLKNAGADVIGLNCGYGITAVESTLARITDMNIPVAVMPNAGLPQRVGARLIYGVSETYFADKAVVFAEMGARIIGGCCGTTPADIKAAARRLKEKQIVRRSRIKKEIAAAAGSPARKQGALLEKFSRCAVPVICEIDPPATLNTEKELTAIKQVVEAGADAVSMAENPLATVKISNLAFAAYVRQQVDTDIILHITGRDKNLLGLQSELLGAHLLGIRGLLLVTGDPAQEAGGAANVFDTDSQGLIRMAAALNQGKKLWDKTAGHSADFSIGAAVNPNMKDFSMQLKKLEHKVEAGAVFTMTQPLFAADQVFRFLDAASYLGIKIFPGIFPVLSARTAEYLHYEVPGITIPEALREALAKAGDKKAQKQTGLEYTYQLLAALKNQVDGFYLIAPYGDPGVLAELTAYLKNPEK